MTIRIEVIVEYEGDPAEEADAEAKLVEGLGAIGSDPDFSGFRVTSAALHGGKTIPGAFQQIVPPTGPGASDAPDPGPGGIPPSQQ